MTYSKEYLFGRIMKHRHDDNDRYEILQSKKHPDMISLRKISDYSYILANEYNIREINRYLNSSYVLEDTETGLNNEYSIF